MWRYCAIKYTKKYPKSLKWFKNKFIPWCLKQPVQQIYMVGGNHDFFLEILQEEIKNILIGTNIHILYNEGTTYVDNSGKSWNIWGSPNCHIFYNWAFMYPDDINKAQYEKMPENVDILITHDAAYEHSDQCLGFMNLEDRELHRGNKPLQEVIENKNPKYHLFGHLHTCDHNPVQYGNTTTLCVSLVNEQYERVYSVTYLEWT